MNNVDLENKIEELNKRLIKLEKIEKRRKIRLIIKISFYVVLIIALCIIGFKIYTYLNKNIIEPINTIKDSEVINTLEKLIHK